MPPLHIMERSIFNIPRLMETWENMGAIDNSPNFVSGKCIVFVLLIINGLRNSVLRPTYVLGKTHLWVRINRRNRHLKRSVYKGKDRRGSSDKGFPKYVGVLLYNIAVVIMGFLCFVEGTVKFCKQA